MASSDQPQSPAGNDSIVPFQQVDVPSALPNCSEFPHQSTHVPLTTQYNTSTVPETPGADLSISFPSIKAEPASSHWAEPGMPLKGTPSAVGALCVRRSMVNLPFAGTPLQNAWFGPTPGRMHDPTAQTEPDFSDSVDEDREEFNQQEAYLLLDIARAQATVTSTNVEPKNPKEDWRMQKLSLGASVIPFGRVEVNFVMILHASVVVASQARVLMPAFYLAFDSALTYHYKQRVECEQMRRVGHWDGHHQLEDTFAAPDHKSSKVSLYANFLSILLMFPRIPYHTHWQAVARSLVSASNFYLMVDISAGVRLLSGPTASTPLPLLYALSNRVC
ncbi:hypothetical protein EDD15DRAFT_2193660 [Pisolithus albus]|nr:hypothetical protein EDD15DRAFT_2193660 [Pisolithus albus]